MSIPIIVSRKKSNGQIQHYNLVDQKLLSLERTFNPSAFNNENKQPSSSNNLHIQSQQCDQFQNYHPRKLSRTKPRRISSSGVSKRFPKDFFKMEQQKEGQKNKRTFQTLNPIRIHNSMAKRPQSMLSSYGKQQVIENVETPKFHKVKQLNPTVDSFNIKSKLDEYCFSNYKASDQSDLKKLKIKPFKIKNTNSRAFISKIKNSLNQTIKKKRELQSDKQNKGVQAIQQSSKQQKKRIVSINGRKVGMEKDEKGSIRLKLLGIY